MADMVEKNRTSPKRLVIDINEELHQQIREIVAKRNTTIRTYVIRAICAYIKKETQYT